MNERGFFQRGKRLTGWRRIASAVWGPPADPQIYGTIEIDASRLLDFKRRMRERGHHVTPTHLAGRALARALGAVPSLNVRLVGSRAIPRAGIDVFFITAVGKGHDLAGVRIDEIDKKSAVEVAAELDVRSRQVKGGDDPDFAVVKGLMNRLPRPLLRVALRASVWLAGKHATAIPSLGLQRTPFGSAMVSSVGMFGLPTGFTPLAWIYTVPVIVLLGEIAERPVAISGRVEVRPILPIFATIDHRYADGVHLAAALKAFREYLEDPARFEERSSSDVTSPRSRTMEARTHSEWIDALRALAPFADEESASRALRATVEALSVLLTRDEWEHLSPALPPELRPRTLTDHLRLQAGADEFFRLVAAREGTRPGAAIEHAELACRVIGDAIPHEARARLVHALPQLARLFEPPEVLEMPLAAHEHRGEAHDLAEGCPGGRHPLASADPNTLAHRHSVARSADPHADTKLSSATGLSQEREGNTLASGRPGSRRPISGSH